MVRIVYSIFFYILWVKSLAGQSATDLKGSIGYIPYMGTQPELVSGISDDISDSHPLIRHIYFVNDTIIGITIDAQTVKRSGLLPYYPTPNDSVMLCGPQVPARIAEVCGIGDFVNEGTSPESMVNVQRYVYRNGKPLGWLVGKTYKHYWPIEQLIGEALNVRAADSANNYSITTTEILGAIHPKVVYRKSKPNLNIRIGPGYDHVAASRHEIFLVLDKPVKDGVSFTLRFENGINGLKPVSVKVNLKNLRSEAIHVNLAGYHPLQQAKYAYLSAWLGNGGRVNYTLPSTFYLLDAGSNSEVYSGQVRLKMSADSIPALSDRFGPDNFNKTNVYRMDFSDFTIPGNYKVYIPGVGVSFPFEINKPIYTNSFLLQMKGFFHQRSGIAMGPPYTTYKRPRNQHPADGIKVYACDKNVFFNDSLYAPADDTYNNPFCRIAKSLQMDHVVSTAWGGWMDAADYDRRYLHFVAIHSLMDVYEYAPAFFEKMDLNIPESGDAIPDIIDEARWCLDLFRRTQETNGEIYYGIESISHPSAGESSWNESLPIALVPGSPGIAYLYAATAARVGSLVARFDSTISRQYLASAIKAVEWADANRTNSLYKNTLPLTPVQQIELSVFLYEATGNVLWKERLLSTLSDTDMAGLVFNQDNYRGFTKLLSLTATGRLSISDSLVTTIEKNLIGAADALLALSRQLAYGEYEDFSYNCWFNPLYGSGILFNAYTLTGNKTYVNTLIEAGHFGMGANPLNATLTTGLGQRFVYQWDEEATFNNMDFATGVPVYGPFPFYTNRELPQSDFFWDKKKERIYREYLFPAINDWPVRETYFELMKFPAMNEFTIMQNMADQAYRWGILAAYFDGIDE